MKKIVSLAVVALLMLVSMVPAFAADSPQATIVYKVVVVQTEGGTGSYEFTTDIDENGVQGVALKAVAESGYTFTHWEIEGPYTTQGKLEDANLNVNITGDITATPYFVKDGQETTGQQTTIKTDDSNKSPQTGSFNATPYVVVTLSLVAAVVAYKVVKTSKEQ